MARFGCDYDTFFNPTTYLKRNLVDPDGCSEDEGLWSYQSEKWTQVFSSGM